jgi:hypothetical protein
MWILGMLWLAGAVAAATIAPAAGVIVRTAGLKDNPSFTAKTLTNLAPGARVNVTERQGGWQSVSLQASPNVKGWVRTYEVRTDIEPGENPAIVKNKGSDAGVLGGLAGLSRVSAGLFGHRDDAGKAGNSTVATIGVRGLNEEDLKKAKPSPTEFAKLMQYGVDVDIAKQYAKAGELKSQTIEALAEVQPEKNKKRRK